MLSPRVRELRGVTASEREQRNWAADELMQEQVCALELNGAKQSRGGVRSYAFGQRHSALRTPPSKPARPRPVACVLVAR